MIINIINRRYANKCVHCIYSYATREGNNVVKIFKNFKEKKAFKPDFGAEGEFYFLI